MLLRLWSTGGVIAFGSFYQSKAGKDSLLES